MSSLLPHSWAVRMFPPTVRLAHAICHKVEYLRASGEEIHPEQHEIFRALELVDPLDVKVVIVGQDPYINYGEANGLAFSVHSGVKLPPSLNNIFKELVDDIQCSYPKSGDLTPWAKDGVLLLNTSLTVRHKESGSHSSLGWHRVTCEILNVCREIPQPVVFMLWGAHARNTYNSCSADLKGSKTCILSSHPSPLGAYTSSGDIPAFIGSKPFSKANLWLRGNDGHPVNWCL